MTEEKELVEEIDIYFSTASSAKYQLINNKDIDTSNGQITNVHYKHKTPAINFKLVHSGYEKYCKSEFDKTESNVNSEVQYLHTKTNFLCYISKGEGHCVPIVRPVLRTFYNSTNSVENNSSPLKRYPNQQQNLNISQKKSLEEFNSDDPIFKSLPVMEEIRQPWIEAIYREFDDSCDQDRRSRLLCFQKDKTIECSIADEIKPLKMSLMKKRRRLPSLSRESSQHSIEAEVLNILLKNQVIRFSKLMQLLVDCRIVSHNIISEKSVLHFLPTIALIIRGLWVLKSEVLYKMCPVENIPSDKMRQARDYILCEFYEGKNVVSKKIQSVTSLPAVETDEILEQLAERNLDFYKKNGVAEWKFPEYDYQFINENSQINAEQLLVMERKLLEVGRLFHETTICSSSGSGITSSLVGSIGNTNNTGANLKAILARKRQLSMTSHSSSHSISNHSSVKRRRSTTESNNYQSDIVDCDYDSGLSDSSNKRKRHNSDKCASTTVIGNPVNPTSTSSLNSCHITATPIEGMSGPTIKEEMGMLNAEFIFKSFNTDVDFENENDDVPISIKNEPKATSQNLQDNINVPGPSNSQFHATETDEVEPNYPCQIFPNVELYKHMRAYLNVESREILIALYAISLRYFEKHLSKSSNQSLLMAGWENENHESIFLKLTECFEYFLDNNENSKLTFKANKISITWPSTLTESIQEQPVYFCSIKEIESENLFLEKILYLLQIQDNFVFQDLKKIIMSDKNLVQWHHMSKPQLIDDLKKYCVMINRRYYLKCTVKID